MENEAEPSTRLELEEDNSNTTCRICRDESLSDDVISPCYCAGSLGRVHVKCLEEWLSKSNKVACEICQYKFHLKKQPRPFREVSIIFNTFLVWSYTCSLLVLVLVSSGILLILVPVPLPSFVLVYVSVSFPFHYSSRFRFFPLRFRFRSFVSPFPLNFAPIH